MTDEPVTEAHREILTKLRSSPRLAHDYLFEHRHEDRTPEFHGEMIDLWHSAAQFVQTEAFRGAAKSTVAEEAIATMACFGGFSNAIVIGASEERAIERVQSIKHEIENNERINRIFGNLVGPQWGAKKAVLLNGTCLQAKGRGQSMRGTKHLDQRPDIVFLDDVEQDDEFIPTEENCRKVVTWLFAVVIPAMHPRRRRVRVAGTPTSPFSLTMQLRKARSWVTRQYPIVYVAADGPDAGKMKATWPSRFPLEWVAAEKVRYAELNQSLTWEQEMMLEPTDPAQQLFTADMLKVDTSLKPENSWHAKYVIYDPARTVTARSGKTTALTGKAVVSWIGSRLIVWEIGAHAWKPDELVNDCFNSDDKYAPVHIGIEEDGLNEFVAQPLRSAQVFRGHSLPIRPLKAPKGKINFIKGLQPFAKAGEIIFAQELPPHVKAQFLSFPVGVIDAPNALAYALTIRPGQPVYTSFSVQNIMPELEPLARAPLWLALNASKLGTTAAIVQLDNGILRIIADWATEEPPGASLRHIIQQANIEAGGKVRCVCGPDHFKVIETIGLRAAAGRIPIELQKMGSPAKGREEMRAMFGRQPGGKVPVQVSTNATWTLRAFSGGYARDYDKLGQLKPEAVENLYSVLMEGIESFLALANLTDESRENSANYAHTSDGRRFLSALPSRR